MSISFRAWRDGRAVEGARLESVYTATYRGFESLSLRQVKTAPLFLSANLFYEQ